MEQSNINLPDFKKAPSGLFVDKDLAEKQKTLLNEYATVMAKRIGAFIRSSLEQILPLEVTDLMELGHNVPEVVKQTQIMMSQLGIEIQDVRLPNGSDQDITVIRKGRNKKEPAVMLIAVLQIRHEDRTCKANEKRNPNVFRFKYGLGHPVIRRWLKSISEHVPKAQTILLSGPIPTVLEPAETKKEDTSVQLKQESSTGESSSSPQSS